MPFGINVWSCTYLVGAPCYLTPLFSNVCVHLENKKRGSRFPFIMKELYDGILTYEHVPQAMQELERIEQELKEIPVSRYVYDFFEPDKPRPEGMKLNYNAVNLCAYITSIEGEEILPMLCRALTEALYFKENVWLGDQIVGVNKYKRPYAEDNTEHFVFVKGEDGLLLDRYFGTMQKVTIPESRAGISVTAIAEKAFSYNNHIEEVFLPDTVTELYAESFYACRNLKKITLGSCVNKIGKQAFSGCYKLTQIELPKALKVIEEQVFDTCFELTELAVPDSVKIIKKEAFADCRKLSVITIPANITEISTLAFRKTKKHLTIISPPGSTAAKYAKKYKIKWVSQDETGKNRLVLQTPIGQIKIIDMDFKKEVLFDISKNNYDIPYNIYDQSNKKVIKALHTQTNYTLHLSTGNLKEGHTYCIFFDGGKLEKNAGDEHTMSLTGTYHNWSIGIGAYDPNDEILEQGHEDSEKPDYHEYRISVNDQMTGYTFRLLDKSKEFICFNAAWIENILNIDPVEYESALDFWIS